MARKSIDDIRNELRKEKGKVKKLKQQLTDARVDALKDAITCAQEVAAGYPEVLFPPPTKGDVSIERAVAEAYRQCALKIARRIRGLT